MIHKFRLKKEYTEDEAWEELAQHGEVLYSQYDPFFGTEIWAAIENPPTFKTVELPESQPLPAIDWNEQWSNHARNFHDGYINLEIGPQTIRLKPGPGFGDLSHPTTNLVLQMMQSYVPNRNVIDVGCGSGILSLAAAALGATHIWAIDIDSEALEHTKENAKLNHFENITVVNSLPLISNPIALMNMIWSEQKEAWPPEVNELIVSGILISESTPYENWLATMGYKIEKSQSESDWLCYHLLKI